jgi:hypothetical protein
MNESQWLFLYTVLAVALVSFVVMLYLVYTAPAIDDDQPIGLYQVQVKDWVFGSREYTKIFEGTHQLCDVVYQDLLKRGCPVSDVRVVQIVA